MTLLSRLTALFVVSSVALTARGGIHVSAPATAQAQSESTNVADVDEAAARKLVRGCSIPKDMKGLGAPASQTILEFRVSETGKLLEVHRVQGVLNHELSAAFASCHFAVYKVDGTPTPFRTNITINAK